MTPHCALSKSGAIAVRVRYCECDPMGYVHHSSYLPWLEMGRTEILREAGVSYRDMEASGYFLVIVKLECRFRRPARYDDLVEIRTRVTAGGRVEIEHAYEVVRLSAGAGNDAAVPAEEVLMTATTTLGCVDSSGRVREMPDWLVAGVSNAG